MIKKFSLQKFSNLIFSLVVAILFLFNSIPAIAQRLSFAEIADTPKHYTELEFSPLSEVSYPEYTRYQLENGMVVYLVEDRDLPLISGSAIIRTGTRLEPGDKVGLAKLTGSLMRNGGTENHSAEELSAILEQDAASIETGIGKTSGSASFNTLTEDLDTVLDLFAEVVRQPVFDSRRLELVKNQRKGAIARRNDDPQGIANREFNKLIYGKTSPYARTIEYETLDNINREDIIAFYQQYIRPENIILGLVGDFETETMQAKIEKVFGNWQVSTPAPSLQIPDVETKDNNSGVYLVDRPELTQSSVLIGHVGDTLANPDYPALSVVNGLLNGFSGRLFNEVRSRQGLAYSVYGLWQPNYDYLGKFMAGGQTQTESTVPFIESVLAEITKLQTAPISEEELTNAKESILNSFVFNFQNPSQTLSRLMRYEYFGYPEDFIFQYQDKVKETTVADIQRVAKQYLKPDLVTTVVVGNSTAMTPSLNSLEGDVTALVIDN